MTSEDKRLQRLQLLDDHIGRSLRESEANGELRAAPSWGKPLAFGDGYAETPPELRMGFKLLKDAGVVPAEVEKLRALAELKCELGTAVAAGNVERERELRQRIAGLRLAIALRLEALRTERRR